jgi:hypothetical protein
MNQRSQIFHVIGSLKLCSVDVDIFGIISNWINVINIDQQYGYSAICSTGKVEGYCLHLNVEVLKHKSKHQCWCTMLWETILAHKELS